MKLLLAVTTFNRMSYLQKTLSTWSQTRNLKHDWTVIVADDGSDDGTIEYLLNKFCGGCNFHLLRHHFQGIHHQVNRILCLSRSLKYQVGFRCDDDLIFKKKGWDDAYLHAIKSTGYDHLVHHDPRWIRKIKKRERILHSSGLLENQAYRHDTQGAFWTFTPKLVRNVGFFDIKNYGPNGFGHRDYTFRCCKAGFNEACNVYDLVDSDQYIELNLNDYHSSFRPYNKWNTPEQRKKKESMYDDDRIYIPYNFMIENQLGDWIWKLHL